MHMCSHTKLCFPDHEIDGYIFFTSPYIITLPCYKRHERTDWCLLVCNMPLSFLGRSERNRGIEWWSYWGNCVAFSPPPESCFQSVALLSTVKNGDFQNIRMYLCSQFWIKQCNWQSIDHCLNLIQNDSDDSFLPFINFKVKVDYCLIILRGCKFGLLRSYVELKWWFHLFTRYLLNVIPRS